MTSRIYNVKVERLPEEKLTYKLFSATTLPAKIDLRSKMPPVYDQGNLGSCTANALAAIFQYDAPTFMGSRLFLYYNERMLEYSTSYDAGATLSSGITCLKKYGICSETTWPYTISAFKTKPPTKCYTTALANRVITATNIQNTAAAMKASLAANEPFVIGFLVYASFESYAVSKTGVVPMPKAGERVLGGHAVVVCGYDDAKQWWIVRNSWGTRWGDKGYFYVPYAYFLNRNLCSDLWNITSIITPKVLPKAVEPSPYSSILSRIESSKCRL